MVDGSTGDGSVYAVVVCRSTGGWHVTCVLFRVDGGQVQVLEPWTELFFDGPDWDVARNWTYLQEKAETGGGNGISYEVGSVTVSSVDELLEAVNAMGAEMAAATHGPHGETKGILVSCGEGSHASIVFPFLLRPDDESVSRLVAVSAQGPAVVNVQRLLPDGSFADVTSSGFVSDEHWHLKGHPAWRLHAGQCYLVTYSDPDADLHVVSLAVDEACTKMSLTYGNTLDLGEPDQLGESGDAPFGDLATSGEEGGGIMEASGFLQRLDVPEWARMGGRTFDWDGGRDYDIWGGQAQWCYAIPWLFEALATPGGSHRMPSAPTPRSDHAQALGYWNTAMYMMLNSLGWTSPAHGLRWWLSEGRPVEDDQRLRLLRDVWWNDGQLELLAAWLFAGADLIDDDHPSGLFTRRWYDEQETRGGALGTHNPLPGGSDSLHLTYHCRGADEEPPHAGHLLATTPNKRHASFVTDSMHGWRRALAEAAGTLPELGERSWHVDVYVKPVGWLGTYRQSRVTGQWFSGKHRYHLPGNPPGTEPF